MRIRDAIAAGTWGRAELAAQERERTATTFGEYANAWLAGRDLKPRTRAHYRRLLDTRLLPAFADERLADVTPAQVRMWHAALDPGTPTIRAHAYALLRTIYTTAVTDDLVPTNPCRIAGAGATKRARTIRPASLAELEVLTAAMPDQLRPMVLVGAWCALRFGELVELRRSDVDLDEAVIRVRRGVVRVGSEVIVGTPKSAAGVRDVAVPPHLVPVLRRHLELYVGRSRDALLFPASDGRNMGPNSLYWHFYQAREAAGRPDLRFHDLRHTGAVLAASTGATLAELMARLGHSTPAAAMKYQHAAADRDRVIADALSRLANGSRD
ncbi:site-specific integrase [Cellulomonas fimi]|nr:site-specific integrase [Cellulomonas fimi]